MLRRFVLIPFFFCFVFQQGVTAPKENYFELQSESSTEVVISLTLPPPVLKLIETAEQVYLEVESIGENHIGRAGFPDLPAITRLLRVPENCEVIPDILQDRVDDISLSHPISPFFQDEAEFLSSSNANFEKQTGLFPEEQVVIGSPQYFRGVKLVPVTVYPYQYNPENYQLIHHHQSTIALRFKTVNDGNINPGDTFTPVGFKTRDASRFLEALTLNPPARDDPHDNLPKGGYLIVVGSRIDQDEAESHVNQLADWKRACGHHVEIVWGESNSNTIYDEHIIPAYREWNPPLEYVCLIGPFNNPDVLNGHDLKYGLIDGGGNDHIPEVAVCRLGASNAERVEVVINRVLGYQKDPYIQNMDWFGRAGSVCERVGRFTPAVTHTVRWIAEAERRAGFNNISHFYYPDDNGSSSRVIDNFISSPGNIIFVRGPSMPSSFPSNSVYPLYIPIGGGHTSGALNRMWNVGSPNQLQGPSFLTGTQHNPNTLSCNVLMGTMARGILLENLPVGWAAGYGMAMLDYNGAGGFDGFVREFQMYGEPGQKAWLGRPHRLEVSHMDRWSRNQERFDVYVENADINEPLENAMVTLTQPGELLSWGYTNEDGECSLPIDEGLRGDITLTVTEDGFIPYYQSIDDRNHPVFVQASIGGLREVNGNGNNSLNPSETVEMFITAENIGIQQPANNLAGIVSCESPWVTIENGDVEFGRIDPGDNTQSDTVVRLTLSPSASEGDVEGLSITLLSDEQEWICPLSLEIDGPELELHEIVGGNVIGLDPQGLQIELVNQGSIRSVPVLAELISLSSSVSVDTPNSEYPGIPNGRSSRADEVFNVNGSFLTIPGTISPMLLLLRAAEDDIPDTVWFDLQVGSPEEGDPMLPDEYGYACYDNTDEGWILAPDYDWIEINPRDDDNDYDGDSPFDNLEGDISREVRLPFEFQFYGEVFNFASICVNGFIALGQNLDDLSQYDNFPLDQMINGSFGMIAPFWDNLDLSNQNQNIFTYYNANEHYFVIEWHNASIVGAGDRLTFEVILYDPIFYRSESGDGKILFQYKTVPDNLSGNHPEYFSTGICSPDGSIGINYVSEDNYPLTSGVIQDRRAIAFTTFINTPLGSLSGTVVDAATGAPLDSVLIMTSHGQKTMTSREGEWAIPDAWASLYFITASKAWYNDLVIDNLLLEEDQEEQHDFQLLHPEFSISSQLIEARMARGSENEFALSLSNDGNGELDWDCTSGYADGLNGIGQQFQSLIVAPIVGDIQLEGVTYINGEFYISGRNSGNPCMIYVLNSEGRLIRRIEQVGHSRNGMFDLTYDGTLIWGSGEQDIFGFDLIGNRVTTFRGPLNNNRALAYDPNLNALWVGNDASLIYAVNNEGEELRRLDSFNWQITGMAYWDDDPDDYNLFILHKVGMEGRIVHKMNTSTGDTILVGSLETEQIGQPGGIFISENMNPFGLVFGMMVNDYLNRDGDRIDIWQMGTDIGWLNVYPTSGSVPAQSTTDLTLQINATDLIPFDYSCQLLVNHTAFGGEAIVDISLSVLDPTEIPEQTTPAPRQLELYEPYPNPFNSSVKLSMYIPKADHVLLSVFDINGREVSRLVDGKISAGSKKFVWNASDFPTGVYVARMIAGDLSEKRKMVLVR
ncbi:MAG: T9SS type A sorting domain-containing protein [Calditrichaeota bacterium]|nr:T9SS type A sorting domain-containing protein [Calditrichota bacterium]